jgi:subtilisin family serine protease
MGKYRISYRYGGRSGPVHGLKEDPSLIVVRTKDRKPLSRAGLSRSALGILGSFTPVVRFSVAGVEVLRSATGEKRKALRDRARKVLGDEENVQFAGRVLSDPNSTLPVLYTENLFVKFEDSVKPTTMKRALRKAGLTLRRELPYAKGACFASAPAGCGRDVFGIAASLFDDDRVELAHPELVRHRALRSAAPQQWHLHKTRISGQTIDQHADVVAAWGATEGEGVTIAVIDDGVDTDHQDFSGAGKVVHPRDVTRRVNSAKPWYIDDNHGTACAGVACANGLHGASGVAPKARLMPVRLYSGLGSIEEADAFYWAAQHGADVISCSWGPADGRWWDDDDPQHDVVVPIPDSTRAAIDWATTHGRNGKGCMITWAAGNGNEPVDNDGYASYEKVVAVAACNDRGTKSAYSDTGDALWCSFPSNDFGSGVLTPGIWTTDRSGGAGYNAGAPHSSGDDDGNYTEDFGGTGAAGVAALVIARNPELGWEQVKDVLKRSCDQIDAGGNEYDASGHSKKYGFGRLNARTAVDLALPAQPSYVVLHEARQDVAIKDNKTSRIRVVVGDNKVIRDVRIHVDIEHTWIGDLVVKVKAPTGGAKTLHDREGGSADNLKKTYDTATTPELAGFVGGKHAGTWTLEVSDRAGGDVGQIKRFGVELAL